MHEDPFSRFHVKLLTDRQIDEQMNAGQNMFSLVEDIRKHSKSVNLRQDKLYHAPRSAILNTILNEVKEIPRSDSDHHQNSLIISCSRAYPSVNKSRKNLSVTFN